jgi:hypothetical protein
VTSQKEDAPGAEPGREPSVLELHEQWTRVLGRISAGPLRRLPKLTRAERTALQEEARALERRIAQTPSRCNGEVALKLKMAACSILMPGARAPLTESAARDLRSPAPGTPLARGGSKIK